MAEISSLLGLITDDNTRQALIAQMENMFDNAPDEERLIQEIGNPTKVAVALIRYADSGKVTPAAAPVVAPEQVQPKRGEATVLPTTDIFSFGVMMYRLLTGKLPFGTLDNEAELALYIKRASEGDWNRSLLSLSAYGTTFLPIIEGCLRPNYKQRLQSVDEVLALLPATGNSLDSDSDAAFGAFPEPLPNQLAISGYRLRIMQGEEYGKTYDLPARQSSTLTMGRESSTVRNTLPIVEEQSSYISRRHCTLRYDAASNLWQIYDGQQDTTASNGWRYSLNGTFVNSTEVGPFGYWLRVGDIISIGDTKLRVEAY